MRLNVARPLPVLVLALLLAPGAVVAATDQVGAFELAAISNVLTGGLGKAIGLMVSVWGIWRIFVSGDTAKGFTLLLVGVAITIFPGVFNFAQSISLPVAHSISGGY